MKRRRINSCIYSKDKAYIVAKDIGMSPTTYKKYLNKIKDLGLYNFENNSIVSIPKCLEILFPEINFIKKIIRTKGVRNYERVVYYIKFFKYCNKATDFKGFKDRIEFALAEANFRAQQYIAKKFEIVELIKNANRLQRVDLRRLKSLKKFHGTDDLKVVENIARKSNTIRTGKNHLGKILGCSPSTGLQRLRKWNQQGRFKRTIIIVYFHMHVCEESERFIKSKSKKYKHLIPISSGYKCYIGSKIELHEKKKRSFVS